jgi:crossover junction endodeoxyribonuclease RuvC
MKSLGIDIGLAITGWAVIGSTEPGKLAVDDYGYVQTYPKQQLPDRLNIIYKFIDDKIIKHEPGMISIEELYLHSSHNKPQYSKTLIATIQARGLIFLLAAQHGIPIKEFNAKTVKLTCTGYGSADKTPVQYVVKQILNLRETPKPDDVADALAISYTGLITGPNS